MRLEKMDGMLWARLVLVSSRYLESRKNFVDALNVFPVPDGDTGTNMSLTMATAAKAVEDKNDINLGNVAKLISHGALMGARGNSGVILSQLLAGFAKKAENMQELDPVSFSEALESAVQTAYQAVMNPVEGTILTVSREASYAAGLAAKASGASIATVLEAAYQGAEAALAMTPDMLPVLKQAGVVDAGGQGFVYILEGMILALKGEDLANLEVSVPKTPRSKIKSEMADYSAEFLNYQYCTEFIIKKREQDLNLDAIRSYLNDKGDCLLVVGSQETSKIHIHTNSPGKVVDYCTGIGSLHEIQIHNMHEQTEEMMMKARALKHIGIIAVSAGSGLTDILKSLGVDVVINGGQTMNPSTQDFVEAIEQILAEEILILPNNGNIILAAQQAALISSKPALVAATRSISQGIAALMAYNPEIDLEENKNRMEEAGKQIITVEITYATRDAQYENMEIVKGQILGIVNDKLVLAGSEVSWVVEKLLADHLKGNYELMTIYYGEGIEEESARNMMETLAGIRPELDYELHYGGQPLYYYLISLE